MDGGNRRAWPKVVSSADPAAVGEALFWLRGGQIVAFPTDTVYGLGTPVDDLAAVERLYQIKGRPRSLGIPLLLAGLEDMERVCRDVPRVAWRLAEHFWPGALTLILWRQPWVSDLVTGGRPTVAVRLPDHPLPQELARRLGRPLAATSANRSGAVAPVTAAAVQEQLGGRIPLILDGGTCAAGTASTIVDLTVEPPNLLRLGPISLTEIREVWS